MGRINTGGVKKKIGDNVATGSSVSGTTLKLNPPKGYYDGVTGTVNITDTDFVASNIKNGINLFGINGTLQTTSQTSTTSYVGSSDLESSSNNINLTGILKEFQVANGGVYKVEVDLKTNNVTNSCSCKVYVNSVYRDTTDLYNGGEYGTRSVEVTVSSGDLIQLRLKNELNGYICFMKNVKLKSTLGAIKNIDVATA